MSNYAYITTIKNVRKHPNADSLQLGECFGNTVCVDLTYKEGQIGLYIGEGAQLSEEFCEHNNLIRKKDENGNNIGGYLDPNKRNVKSIRLRGANSDGLFLPLSCIEYTKINLNDLKVGDLADVVNGHVIATKYVPRTNHREFSGQEKKKISYKAFAPLFEQHVDTQQLMYNLDKFKSGDLIEITLKLHGTSGRTAYLPILKGYKKNLLDYILRREGKPVYGWGHVTGTRRTVLDPRKETDGYYNDKTFRLDCEDKFIGKLHKGETVYYEIVAFTNDGTAIMGQANVPKEYQSIYGKSMIFSYGLQPPQHEVYVYRMTMTNEDGKVVEYPPDYMRYRCEQMGVKTPPLFYRGIIPEVQDIGKWITDKAHLYYGGPDPIGLKHVREGVVVRKVNSPTFEAYKLKNFLFKLISGIIVEKIEDAGANVSEDILEEL